MGFLTNLTSLRRHRFFRWILVVSTATTLAFPLFAHLAVYPMFERLLIANSETEAVRAAHFLVTYMDLREERITGDALPANIDGHAHDAVANLELAKFKVFSPEGMTVYSTDAADIGVMNSHVYFRDRVMRGEAYSKVVRKTRPTLEGESYTVDLVETYVPVMTSDGMFAGAFEIYYDVTGRLQRMAELMNYVTGMTVAGALALLAMIFWLLSRAGHALQQQDRMEGSLRELNHRQQMILDTAGEGIFGVDAQGRLSFINPAALDMMAWPERLILNECHHSLIHHTKPDGTSYPPEECPIQRSLESRAVIRSGHEVFWRKNGTGFPVDMTVAPLIEQDEVTGAVVVFHDITQRLESERALHDANILLNRQVRMDGLTDILNRRAFDEIWESAWHHHRRYRKPLSLLLIDVDFFKRFNDHYGHPAGDDCLRSIAHVLSENLYRPEDSLARYGGEEFVATLSDTGPQAAQHVAQRLLQAVQDLRIPHESSDVSPFVTVSIGIAYVAPETTLAASEAIRSADQALYLAKKNGRNRIEALV